MDTEDLLNEGLGLGLTTAKQILNEMGGQLFAYSDGFGRGSTFRAMIMLDSSSKGALAIRDHVMVNDSFNECHDVKISTREDLPLTATQYKSND